MQWFSRLFTHISILFLQQNLTYAGLSSAIDDSSDSDWTEDVDDADDGRNKMGTDPWAQESVMGVTGSKWEFLRHVLFNTKCKILILHRTNNPNQYFFYWLK